MIPRLVLPHTQEVPTLDLGLGAELVELSINQIFSSESGLLSDAEIEELALLTMSTDFLVHPPS